MGLIVAYKRRQNALSSGNNTDPFKYNNFLEVHTTSTSSAFNANFLTSNEQLKWVVSGDIADAEYVENNPSVDLSGNTGTAIIKIYGVNDMAGFSFIFFNSKLLSFARLKGLTLTHMRFYNNFLQQLLLEGSDVTTELSLQGEKNLQVVDVPPITAKTIQMFNAPSITTIDLTDYPSATLVRNDSGNISNINFDTVSGHPTVTTLNFLGNTVAPNFDLSLFPNLISLSTNSNSQTDLDFSQNPVMTSIILRAVVNASTALNLHPAANGSLTFLDTQDSGIQTIQNAGSHPNLRIIRVKNSALTVSQLNRLILDVRANEYTALAREFSWGNLQPTRTEFTTDDVLEAWNWFNANGWDMNDSLAPI